MEWIIAIFSNRAQKSCDNNWAFVKKAITSEARHKLGSAPQFEFDEIVDSE